MPPAPHIASSMVNSTLHAVPTCYHLEKFPRLRTYSGALARLEGREHRSPAAYCQSLAVMSSMAGRLGCAITKRSRLPSTMLVRVHSSFF
jgi:hypothetical protein